MAEREAAGLYVHIPFCSAICPYCDFAVARGGEADRERFVAALDREIEECGSSADEGGPSAGGPVFEAARFDTVYFGGGTPSALSVEQLGALRRRLVGTFEVDPGAEWTIEVNPEDASAEALVGWRELGFDRISLGLQALDDRALRFLGRRHDAAAAWTSVERAREAGFRSVSIDLIYSLPGFDGGWWLRTLEEATALGPDHISCYELTIHDGTPFGRRRDAGRLREAGEDERAANFVATHRRLAELGYEGYEVSNFARREGDRSRHNRKYWRHQPYLGLGPSSHSFAGRSRWWNVAPWRGWSAAIAGGDSPVAGREELTEHQLLLEAVMMGLRQRSGIDGAALERRFGIDPAASAAGQIEAWEKAGWLRVRGRRLEPTLEGMARADRLAGEWRLP
ncbi:MAG: radical SAM family heme chaperone HemW [Holophagales bacterium]|nr:radical SAM family heme chaperone HemW [Holophagales bacterium]MYG29084.1 radical SAM family heme chaperone HemW [Holophagales bacterium]MYI80596.1 radical SAM family heme chaperone HemW [Holophagales bacterium]